MCSKSSHATASLAGIVVLTLFVTVRGASAFGHKGLESQMHLVNCHAPGSSIQRTVDAAALGRPITVLVRGTCVEDVNVRRDDVSLVAHSLGGAVEGTINVIGAQRFLVDGLRVSGSGDGITALDNASATIRNAMVEHNSGSGVSAIRNALVILHDNVIRKNDAYGLLVTDGANAQVRGGNTIESDVADWLNVGAAIGAYRHATIRIRDGGNVITNAAMGEVIIPAPPAPPLPPGSPPPPPQLPSALSSSEAVGFAIDVEHNSSLRQDQGHAAITGHVEIFNLTSADFRDMDFTGHIFVDGLNANVRIRNSSVDGGMTMFGEASLRDSVQFTGYVFCHGRFLNPSILDPTAMPPPVGARIDCAPEIFMPPPIPAP